MLLLDNKVLAWLQIFKKILRCTLVSLSPILEGMCSRICSEVVVLACKALGDVSCVEDNSVDGLNWGLTINLPNYSVSSQWSLGTLTELQSIPGLGWSADPD